MSSKFQNDKYYTPEHIVNTCFDTLSQLVDFSAIPMVIEPSAGDGALLEKLKNLFLMRKRYF